MENWLLVVFTLVLAVFTGMLWWSTHQLWKAAERQISVATEAANQARRAADAATASAEATQRMTGVMQDTAERQLRAYISASPTLINLFNETRAAQAGFRIENHGQTPAQNLAISSNVAIFPYPLPPNFQFPELKGPGESRAVVHPGSHGDGSAFAPAPFTRDQLELICKADQQRLYVFGRITYTDIFGKNRETRFCSGVTSDRMREITGLDHLGGGVSGTDLRFPAANQHNSAT